MAGGFVSVDDLNAVAAAVVLSLKEAVQLALAAGFEGASFVGSGVLDTPFSTELLFSARSLSSGYCRK